MNDNKLVKYWRKVVLENFANFKGRARREEYWFFTLANFIAVIVLSIVLSIIKVPALLFVYYLGIIIPGLAVSIRRLHDTGKSGWFLLLGLIPLIGGIILLVFFFSDSHKGTNKYGTSEKYPEAA